MPRKPDPDRLLVARLSGIAARHARRGGPTDEAVAELREVAKSRADLLADVAGTALGAADAHGWPEAHHRQAELCILAGADESRIPSGAVRCTSVDSGGSWSPSSSLGW